MSARVEHSPSLTSFHQRPYSTSDIPPYLPTAVQYSTRTVPIVHSVYTLHRYAVQCTLNTVLTQVSDSASFDSTDYWYP